MKTACQIALKEWDVVVRALREGRQTLLLRKGGISDVNGVFTLKESEFFLFPTYEHQSAALLNERSAGDLARSLRERRTDGRIALDTYATVTDVRIVRDAQELADVPSRTVWSKAYVNQRLAYKPEKPLFLVTVKAHRLAEPRLIENDASYAGCVSWVPLTHSLSIKE